MSLTRHAGGDPNGRSTVLSHLEPDRGRPASRQVREAFAVVAFEEVDHLVHDDVIQAVRRLLDQFQVEPMRRLAVQVPHLVFIRLTPHSAPYAEAAPTWR